MSDMIGYYDPHMGHSGERSVTPAAFVAPVMQPDGSFLWTLFATYELALAACEKFENDVKAKASQL